MLWQHLESPRATGLCHLKPPAWGRDGEGSPLLCCPEQWGSSWSHQLQPLTQPPARNLWDTWGGEIHLCSVTGQGRNSCHSHLSELINRWSLIWIQEETRIYKVFTLILWSAAREEVAPAKTFAAPQSQDKSHCIFGRHQAEDRGCLGDCLQTTGNSVIFRQKA